MAGFTSLALLGGGLLAAKLLKKKAKPQTLAPAPVDTGETGGNLTPPAPPIVNPADMQTAAIAAANKARKRAARGSLLTNPTAPKSNTMPVAPRLQQRSLLGS
jgi:hypothetical protein